MVYWYIYIILIKLGEKMHLRMVTGSETGEYAFNNYQLCFKLTNSNLSLTFFHPESVSHVGVEADSQPNMLPGKRKGKKKKESVKDVARDHVIPPAVLLLQCHVYLAEGLTLVI